MKNGWNNETDGSKRLLSMLFNKGPLSRVEEWALIGLGDEDVHHHKWHPRLKLFCWTSDFDQWWVTRRRVTRRPYHKLYEKAVRESAKP